MNTLEFIKYLGVIPMSVESPCTKPSGSEIRRWCDQGAVVINGKPHRSKDEVEFPVTNMIFFPKGKRRTTVI